MGRKSSSRRQMRISQANHRQHKLARLRQKYLKMTGAAERKIIWQKVNKVAPWLKEESFSRSEKSGKK